MSSEEKILLTVELKNGIETLKAEIENPDSRLNRWASLVEEGHEIEAVTSLLKNRVEEIDKDGF